MKGKRHANESKIKISKCERGRNMSKKISVILIGIIIIISLALSIYIPNKDKIKDEKEDTSINYSVIEKDGKKGVAQNDKTIIEPQYDEVVIPNQHREVFYCKNLLGIRCEW